MSSSLTLRRAWIAWLAICLIWGTTYLAIKVALDTVPPFLMGGFRYVFGGLILSGLLFITGRKLPPTSHWPMQALLGFFMLTIGNGGVVWGEQYLTSGLTAVVVATSAFWMVGVDALLPSGHRPHLRQGIGLLIGFIGIIVLLWPDISRGGVGAHRLLLGVASLQLACAGWALASAYTRRHVQADNVLGAAALQMLFGGVFLLVGGSATGEWAAFSLTMRTSAALLYLIVAGSVIAFVAYSYALKHLPMAIVSLYTYVNPVIAVALGIVLLHEPIAMRQAVAAAVILSGMLIVRPSGRPLPDAGQSQDQAYA